MDGPRQTNPFATLPKEAVSGGKLADNIVYFARTLRKAGLKLGPASVVDAIHAVEAGGISSRDDFYWTLHCIFVRRREDSAVFSEAFRLFWKSRELVEKLLAMFSPQAPGKGRKEKPRSGETRVSDALFEGHQKQAKHEPPPMIEVDAQFTASEREILREKDFAQMTAAELAQAREAMRRLPLVNETITTRRFMPAHNGRMVDMRGTLRNAMHHGGEMVDLTFRKKREIYPPLVILADISGSMSQYSRIFLHFMHAMAEKRRKVHTFVFGTRLTNLTRELRHRDIDEALEMSAAGVRDWSGGTRIGETIGEFNRLWSRRVLGQGASVLLISDGLEREGTDRLEIEMDRLHKSCRRLIWLNPLLRYDGFEAKAAGVRVMLSHVDEFRPVHSLDKLSDLCLALQKGGSHGRDVDPKLWLNRVKE